MSTAAINTTAPITHLPHTAHPLPLREQAFTLHCQGLRSPAIADELGVPERTIRAWIAAALNEIKEDQQFSRREQLALAVERQRFLTVAAWQQFEAEATVRAALLDAALATATHPDPAPAAPAVPNAPTTDTLAAPDALAPAARPAPLHLRLPATTPAPRYLSLILQANKEIARLLGLYALARLELLTPPDPSTDPADVARDTLAAATTALATDSPTPAETATAPTAADPVIPAASATAPFIVPAEREAPLSARGEGALVDSGRRPGTPSPLRARRGGGGEAPKAAGSETTASLDDVNAPASMPPAP